VTPLQLAQEGEQRGDLAADILIDAMQPHERIEAGRGDHLDVEFGQRNAGGDTDALDRSS
jgi:hypothetical protein